MAREPKISSLGWRPALLATVALGLCACRNEEQSAAAGKEGEAERAPESPPQQPESHLKMLAALAEIARRTPTEDEYLGNAKVLEVEGALASFPADAPLRVRFQAHFQLGMFQLNAGNESASIDHFLKAQQFMRGNEAALPVGWGDLLLFRLGVAYLRLGETQNCCARNSPESCIVPIQGGGLHTKPEGSSKAIECFQELLRRTPRDSGTHLGARWLLNIAYMTLGKYPGAVPPAFLIPPEHFSSAIEFPRFPNIAAKLGLDTFSLSGGAIADDFDGDGYLDLVVSTWDPNGQIRYFRNEGDGTFSERTRAAGLTGLTGGLNLVQADYDNDGDLDIYVMRGAWRVRFGKRPNSLLRNNGPADATGGITFTDVTFETGLGHVHHPTPSAAWSDFDNDGDLDLFVANEYSDTQRSACQLFRNEGPKGPGDEVRFVDVAAEAGVENRRFTKGATWGDFNGDGRPDLYLSNLGAPNRLYRNDGKSAAGTVTFTDVAAEAGVELPTKSFPCWFWDFDNDGALDLYVASYSAHVDALAASHLGLPVKSEQARLFRGDGKGGFAEVSKSAGITNTATAPMGSNFGDLDNDGFLDFYLGTGFPDYKDLMPNRMFLNCGGLEFADVTMAGGFGHLQKGHAIAFADFDNDGDQDIFQQMGGAYPGDRFHDALYENPGFGNHWIAIQLVGVESNRSAIGARLRFTVRDADGSTRFLYRHVNSGGSFGANPLRQAVGLGTASRIEQLEIFWPTSGRTQSFADLPGNQFLRIIEGKSQPEPIHLDRLKLGGR